MERTLIKLQLLLLLIGLLSSEVQNARILCVFPMPSISHQSVFRAYTQELARQGHELIIVTTEPALPKERPPDNITEIDVGPLSYDLFSKMLMTVKNKGLFKRGVIIDLEAYVDDSIIDLYTKMCAAQLKHPDIVKIINDHNQRFDLVVIEAIVDFPLILSEIFKAPVIWLSSFYGYEKNFKAVGAFTHPFLYPQCFKNNFGGVVIWEKLNELYSEWRLNTFYAKVKEVGDRLLKVEFGSDAPTIDELRNNVQMLFINVHPIYDGNRPVPPSVKYLGGLHLKPAKAIPQDLKTYLDESKHGVIYVSMGTIVRPSEMDRELLDHFVKAFERLPYNILWKFDAEYSGAKPKNVKIQKWFPQRELLLHPNIKAFVTQGGLQSTDEAIDAAVPMVGIPFLVDQWYNVYKSEEIGIAVRLDTFTLTSDDIIKGVTTVIENESYKRNILKLRSIIQDQPETSLQRAIWWTEYLLRHGGAHLRSSGANISWSEYLMLDVVLPVLVVIISAILILSFIFKCVIQLIFKPSTVKLKQE